MPDEKEIQKAISRAKITTEGAQEKLSALLTAQKTPHRAHGMLKDFADVTNRKKNFPSTSFLRNYEALNEIVHGKKPEWMAEGIKDFKEKTGAKVHFDNNISQEDFEDYLLIIKARLDINDVNDLRGSKEIFVTDFLRKGCEGAYYDGTPEIYVRPREDKADFYEILVHEDVHFMDYHHIGKNYPKMKLGPLAWSNVTNNVSDYATKDRHEFVAELKMMIANGKFYVMENDDGETVLRAYQSQHKEEISPRQIKGLANLYMKMDGPKIPPSGPPEWDEELMEALGTDYVETPIKFSQL
jgi:hypothetical protein